VSAAPVKAPAYDLEARLRDTVAAHYHHLHPFNQRMHGGELRPEELRTWVLNRYEYQRCIPVKDALILARLPSVADRVRWRLRIADQDGTTAEAGGLEAWLRLGEAVGLRRDDMERGAGTAPAARYACEAYVDFCRRASWLPAVASSLTELMAPQLMSRRVDAFLEHYPWVEEHGLDYFRRRVGQGSRDAVHALELVLTHARTPSEQDAVVAALHFKCDVLWAFLDAVERACMGGCSHG